MSEVINRNNVDKELVEHEILKGEKRKGKKYLAPVTSVATWDNDSKWIGVSDLVNVTNRWLKQSFQNLWFGCIDEATGQINMPQFLKEGSEFTSSGMKLSEINDQLDEVEAKQKLVIMNAPTNEDGMFSNPADVHVIQDLNKQAIALRAMRDARSRKGKDAEDNAEPAVATA